METRRDERLGEESAESLQNRKLSGECVSAYWGEITTPSTFLRRKEKLWPALGWGNENEGGGHPRDVLNKFSGYHICDHGFHPKQLEARTPRDLCPKFTVAHPNYKIDEHSRSTLWMLSSLSKEEIQTHVTAWIWGHYAK